MQLPHSFLSEPGLCTDDIPAVIDARCWMGATDICWWLSDDEVCLHQGGVEERHWNLKAPVVPLYVRIVGPIIHQFRGGFSDPSLQSPGTEAIVVEVIVALIFSTAE